MNTPSFREDHISQIPALLLLQNLGYKYLSPDEALALRGNRSSNVILEDVLRKQLNVINSIRVSSSRTSVFSASNIEAGIQALKDLPMNEGYISTSEYVYDLLTLGKSLEQSIDGDKKSFTLNYIDWNDLSNNVFHVTEEFNVMRSNSREHYCPDIVLFINGIPICIIECKRPDKKDSISQAISQHLRNQQDDGIRALYVYSQIILSASVNDALYATNGTTEEFWSGWKERFQSSKEEQLFNTDMTELKNSITYPDEYEKLLSGRFRYVRNYFEELSKQIVQTTVQDKLIYCLLRPDRLMDLIHNFIIFDAGEKKIARYQQFFAIKKTMIRLTQPGINGKRKGGVIWHTQGSGKSLTMVLLAQAIAIDKSIRNPKIILVTDRIELDDQLTGVFQKCGKVVKNAATGTALAELLESKSDAVVTTVVNKFESALRKIRSPLESSEIFVLVDEGHRTQYGSFNIQMQKTLPNACFIAMTGTPLMKKEKNTAAKFGGIIDSYTVLEAVEDKAVVPLLYEGRHALQDVSDKPVDIYFSKISESLNKYEVADLKRKFSRADQLNIAEQKVFSIAWDISLHFKENWQGTPFKGQLVCQSKSAALLYKRFLDEIGIVTSEVLISPPDDREGEDSAHAKSDDLIKRFWDKMMSEHGTSKKYEKNLISRFKKQKDPEIIIVVDKLLTGFDEPKNTVLYLTRNLSGHKLLQAVARVNRIHPDKDHGYIIDYYGVLSALDLALTMYSNLNGFEENDIEGMLTDISEEAKKLPQKHSELWSIFREIQNKSDHESYQRLLRDDAVRAEFYAKLAAYAKSLKIALASIEFHKITPEDKVNKYKNDLSMFMNLRSAVAQRYSDEVDYKLYAGQIQKLIDMHVHTSEVIPITGLVNIFDKDIFQAEVAKLESETAKADMIASRTNKYINEKMDEDPAFYMKFSEMLKDTIRARNEERITENEMLGKVTHIMNSVLSHTDSGIPEELNNNDAAKAFFGLCNETLLTRIVDEQTRQKISSICALKIDSLIKSEIMNNESSPIVDWGNKSNITGKLIIRIGDFLIDELKDKSKPELTFDEVDDLAEKCIDVAKKWYR